MVGLMPLASELVKLPKRSREHAGPGRRAFEQTLEIVIVIFIQTANGNLLFWTGAVRPARRHILR